METPDQRADQIPIVAAADNGRRSVPACGFGTANDAVHALMPDGHNALFPPVETGGRPCNSGIKATVAADFRKALFSGGKRGKETKRLT